VFPLPCALLGLIGPLHRGVLCPRSAAASWESGGTHERLASRQPRAMAVCRLFSLCAAILPYRARQVSNVLCLGLAASRCALYRSIG
jgi:hypothetical protein